MRFDVISLFPPMIESIMQQGVIARAHQRQLFDLHCWNPRDFCDDNYKTVDDRPYGGGPGMVMMAEPLDKTLISIKKTCQTPARVIYFTPQGRKLDQKGVEHLAQSPRTIMVCGRYEGIDERFVEAHKNDSIWPLEEWSIGDYVLAGGELAALVMIESMVRLKEGVLGNELSAVQDSFSNGLLDYPHYTRPDIYEGSEVPAILRSGDHEKIRRWRLKQSLGRTWLKRPDLLTERLMSKEEQFLLTEFKRENGVENDEHH